MAEQENLLREATKKKIMESFAQLDGGLAQLERRLDYLEKTVENVDQRTASLQQKIQMRALRGDDEDTDKK